MKRIKFLTVIVFFLVTMIFTTALANSKEKNVQYFDGVNTLNFIEKSGFKNFNEIEKICSDDYCDIVKGDTSKQTIELFTKGYLENIKDSDVKASLLVKGIKITKIYLKN